jgi:hypothetical protein
METEEENTFVVQKYYNYKSKRNLKTSLEKDHKTYKNVYICSYDVTNKIKYPFQRFLLVTSTINDKLSFPAINIFKSFVNTDDFLNYVQVYLFGLLELNDDNNDYEEFSNNLDFNGFMEHNNGLYIFFDITSCNLKINDIYKSNNLWLVLIDEIVNQKHLCNIAIEPFVTDLFISNPEFCFLLDENDEAYEIPIVSFIGKPSNKLNFTFIFGEKKGNKNWLLGPFYYFTDYFTSAQDTNYTNFTNLSCKNNEDLPERHGIVSRTHGIVRLAVFIGFTKYIENGPCDSLDESSTKREKLEDDQFDKQLEGLTMRITDYDGKWAEDYDSAYLGNVELDNGVLLNNKILAIKNREQYIPLSYHFIDIDKNNIK